MLVWPPADPEAGPAITLESRSNLLHQGGQPKQHPPHRHLQHAGNVRVMGNHLLGAWLSARGVMAACVTFLRISLFPSQRRWINLHPQSRVRRGLPVLRVLLFPDNWITGARNQWTRDYSLLSLWSTTSADLPSILLLQTLRLPEGTKQCKASCYNLFRQILHFYCCHPYEPKSFSVFTTPFQSPKLTETVHKKLIFQPISFQASDLYQGFTESKWHKLFIFLSKDLYSYLHDWRSEGLGRNWI